MRTFEEIRKKLISELHHVLQDPILDRCSADLFFGWIFRQLLWLDERSQEDWDTVRSQLLHGPSGVFGQIFNQVPGLPSRFVSEVTSTYAQVAFRLGYYNPDRLLTESELDELHGSIDSDFLLTDHTRSELLSRFGKPTHKVSGETQVHCYGSENPDSYWVYFDYAVFGRPTSLPGPVERFDDPFLRDVRRGENRIELLPMGSMFYEKYRETGYEK